MTEKNIFGQSLHNFTQDFASGGAIRHLWDFGYTVDEIQKQLSFPTPREQIQKTIWKYLLDKKIVCLEQPLENQTMEKVTYVSDEDAFGRTSLRRVVEPSTEKLSYVTIHFGTLLYKDREGFMKKIEKLNTKDQAYILDIPWPLGNVYHLKNNRIEKILALLNES